MDKKILLDPHLMTHGILLSLLLGPPQPYLRGFYFILSLITVSSPSLFSSQVFPQSSSPLSILLSLYKRAGLPCLPASSGSETRPLLSY